jgi:hypothetical protein
MLDRLRISCSIFLCLAGVAFAQAPNGSTVPSVETILTRMASARAENRMRLRPYRVTRDYRLLGKGKQTAKSEVIADVTFAPPDIKHYAIRQANGIALGESIVRQMLEHETDILKNNGATDMSPANYDFRFIREEDLNGQHSYVLEMLPWRKDQILLRGQIWVDSTTYLLHRTEGEPGKAPSWWLRDSRIVLVYGDVGGMWLQTGSESTANVRFLGQHIMLSRDLEYKIGEPASDPRSSMSTPTARPTWGLQSPFEPR